MALMLMAVAAVVMFAASWLKHIVMLVYGYPNTVFASAAMLMRSARSTFTPSVLCTETKRAHNGNGEVSVDIATTTATGNVNSRKTHELEVITRAAVITSNTSFSSSCIASILNSEFSFHSII